MRRTIVSMTTVFLAAALLAGCQQEAPQAESRKPKVGMVLDTGGDRDHGFNEYSLRGARESAERNGLDFSYLTSESPSIYERNIDKVIEEGADLVFTVGFWLANATAKAAVRYPDRHFVIMDYAYYPGQGCPETVQDCYTRDGGLQNVTSLLFSEDQAAYMGGALAGCMTESNVIGTVAGYEIPPVVRFVEGFEKGARAANPEVATLRRYIPDFNDAATGYSTAMGFFSEGADVLYCVGGSTGLGALKAAKENGTMAIGVDVDQYLTYPEAGSAIVTSIMKNVDVVASIVVDDFARGQLTGGIRTFDLVNDAMGLAPFHDWQDKVPDHCLEEVEKARQRILADPTVSLPDSQRGGR